MPSVARELAAPVAPDAEAYSTVMSSPGALSKVTVKVAVPSTSATVWLAIVIATSSSSVITKSAVVVSPVIVALVALDNVKVAVSVDSLSVSEVIGTSMVPDVAPAEIVKVPVVPV